MYSTLAPKAHTPSCARKFIIPFLLSLLVSMASTTRLWAQTAPNLSTASSFAVLGGSTVTNTGPSVVTGDLGVSPGTAVTGFPPGIVIGGTIHAADAAAAQAQADTTTAYNALASQACQTTYGVPTDIGGLTLLPGVYCFSSSAGITGTLTLDAQADPNAVFIFKTGSTLITASNATVALINGAQPCNVFWQVGSSATLGTGTSFAGSILALASITLNTNASINGRALARTGAVTLDSNTVTASSCAAPPVNAPPTLSKSFTPATILAGATSTLTLTLTNSNATSAALTSPLTDTFPSGLLVSGTPSTTCGGSVVATGGGSALTLSGAAIPANGSCTVTATVTSTIAGSYINSLPAGALVTSSGSNAAPAIATLVVNPVLPPTPVPPTLGKSFSPSVITVNQTSTLTLTLSNSNASGASLTAPLTDLLPMGMTIVGNASTTCGGPLTATTGSASITLLSGFIPGSGSCIVQVDVHTDCACSYQNSIPAGALQTTAGNNAQAAAATLTVGKSVIPAGPPVVTEFFTLPKVKPGVVTVLSIKFQNSGPAAGLTAPFVNVLPSGLAVYAFGSNTCGGTVTAVKGSNSFTLTGGVIPAYGGCTLNVQVVGTLDGTYVNTIAVGALQTTAGSNLLAAQATLTISSTSGSGVRLGKDFSPKAIKANGTSVLTLTLSNPFTTPTTLTAPLVDQFPAGLTISGAARTTCGGTLTALLGSSRVTLTGGVIAANSVCTITVPVTAVNNGTYTNTIVAGGLKTSNGSTSTATSATLDVRPTAGSEPFLAKSFSPSIILNDTVSTLTITLTNPYGTSAVLTAPLIDTLPAGLVIYGSPATSCGGVASAVAGGSSLTLTGGAIPANGSCTLTVQVTAPCNSYYNFIGVGALQTTNGSNQAGVGATLKVVSNLTTH